MLTILDLLEDPKYKEFFCKVPKLLRPDQDTPPWRVYVQLKKDPKRWRTKDFYSYTSAFKFLKRLLNAGVVHDGTIHCRRQSFKPPQRLVRVKGKFLTGPDGKKRQVTRLVTWVPKIEGTDSNDYRWCPYCRRPTKFSYYTKHPAVSPLISGLPLDASIKRCHICGVSTRMLTQYQGMP